MGLSKSYGDLHVLRSMSFALEDGGRYCLMGPSGAGKTTLLRCLLGLERADAGEVSGLRPGEAAVVFQEDRLCNALTAVENVLLVLNSSGSRNRSSDKNGRGSGSPVGRDDYGDHGSIGGDHGSDRSGDGGGSKGAAYRGDKANRQAVRELLGEILPASALDKPALQLSGGQRRRVSLARAMAYPSKLVVMDEPFTGLDMATRQQVINFVLRHQNGRTLLISTHGEDDARMLGAEVLQLAALQAG